jgi:hypothetical protein
MSKHLSRLGYCQYLLTSPTNYTLTNFANHVDDMSHDAITRYLRVERLTPRLVWDNVRTQVVAHADGCVLFDDTVLDKNHSHRIELVRRQYSGNAHALIKGIGVVNCVVNPQTGEYWIIDYRIYDPDGDGKSKLDHVRDMLGNLVHHKGLLFRRVLMDTWYATRDLMLFIESLSKTYYCRCVMTVWSMMRAVSHHTGGLIRCNGMKTLWLTARQSRPRAFRSITR